MKNFKKVSFGAMVLACVMMLSLFLVACKKDEAKTATAETTVAAETTTGEAAAPATTDTAKKNVTVTTSFLLDMTKVLAGDFVNVELIIPAGEDPHLYNAKPEDKAKFDNADLLLYHGLHFEGHMVDALEAHKNSVAVSADFPADKIGEMDEDGQKIQDPHFWFDLGLYKLATQKAAEALEALLPEQKDTIAQNATAYLAKLDELDGYIKEQIAQIPENSRVLITPHDAFNYFSRAYGVEVQAPQGVSTDSEVASEDVSTTVNLIVDRKVKAIFAESTTDPKRMEKLQEDVKAKGFDVKVVQGEGNELFSDSLAPEGQPGDTFLDMYKHNVDLIVSNLK